MRELAVDSSVTPARVVASHAEDERADAADGGRSSRPLGVGYPGVVAAQQVVVPAQDGVGGDDQVKAAQRGPG